MVAALSAIGVGAGFGETSAIGIIPHTASAVVTEDAELLMLSGSALYKLYQEDLETCAIIVLSIAREACRRLARSEEVLLRYAVLDDRECRDTRRSRANGDGPRSPGSDADHQPGQV